MKQIDIFIHGSCDARGRGGWAATLVCGNSRKVLSGSDIGVSAASMELEACIQAFLGLKYSCQVCVHVANDNIRKAFTDHWIERWRQNGWRHGRILHRAQWQRLAELVSGHEVRWVRPSTAAVQDSIRTARQARLQATPKTHPPKACAEQLLLLA